MTIFIYEHLTSGALADEAFSPGLMHEGDAMLQALCQDLTALGHQLCVMRDTRLPELNDTYGNIHVLPISSELEYHQVWQESQKTYQGFVVIAPETEGILQRLVANLEQKQKQHFGASAEAIALCSDKLKCCRILQQANIATPETRLALDWLNDAHSGEDWIIKPIDGAGCEDTFRLNREQTTDYLFRLSHKQLEQTIIQPFILGDTLSLSLFIENTKSSLLSVNRQHINISDQHQLTLSHCEPTNEPLLHQQEVETLIQKIHATMPGLWGFVGIDLIYSEGKLWVIEINPRLTSSYAVPAFRQQRNPASQLSQYLTA